MKETLEKIEYLESKIVEDIKTIAKLLTPEILEYAQNEKKFWAGAIGHIKRRIQLYALTIPSFEVPEDVATEDDAAVVSKFIDSATADLKNLEYPNVNRVYKLNLEAKSKFDVIEEIVEEPTKAIYREPIGMETYTREFWQEVLNEQQPPPPFHEAFFEDQNNFFDEDIIAAAKNFMLGPCGAWKNKALLAETKTFDSLDKLKEDILKEAQEKDMVLYKTYTRDKLEYEEGTFKLKENGPKITLYYWRGAFIDKDSL
jgi:hypothetical protein